MMDETDQAQPPAQPQPPAPDTSSAAFQAAVAAEVARRLAPVTLAPDPQPMPQSKPPSFFQSELDALGNLVDAGHLHPLLKGVIESLIRAVESHL